MGETKVPLAKVLEGLPDRIFWAVGRGHPVPHFNRIYAEVLRQTFGLRDLSDEIQLHLLFTGAAPNLSSFQRAVAKEASRRRDAGEDPPAPTAPAAPSATPPAPGRLPFGDD